MPTVHPDSLREGYGACRQQREILPEVREFYLLKD